MNKFTMDWIEAHQCTNRLIELGYSNKQIIAQRAAFCMRHSGEEVGKPSNMFFNHMRSVEPSNEVVEQVKPTATSGLLTQEQAIAHMTAQRNGL